MRRLALLALAAAVMAACASSPSAPGPQARAPEPAEETRPSEAWADVAEAWSAHARSYPDEELDAYVHDVGMRVAQRSERPDLAWTFQVLDSTDINAHSLRDRHVAVTRGLLAHLESEAELAAVLAHEISHVVCRHTSPTADAWLPEWFEPFDPGLDRDPLDERQADQMAASLLARTQYPPRAIFEALRSLRRIPSPGQRLFHEDPTSDADETDRLLVRTARAALVTADAPSRPWGRARYLARVDGLPVGPDPRAGALRDGRFVVPWAEIAFDLPPGLEAAHELHLLSLAEPETGAVVILMPATRELTDPGSDIATMMSDVRVGTMHGVTVRSGDYRGPESGAGRMAVLDADGARFLLMSGGRTPEAVARSRELHRAVLLGLSRRVGPPIPTARLRIVANDGGLPTAESRGSCPEGTDLELSVHLNDPSSTARRLQPGRVKCAVRDESLR